MRPPLTGSGGRADDVGRRRGGFRGERRRGGFRGGRAGGEIAGGEIADDVGRRRGGFRGGRADGGRAGGEIAGGEIADDVGRRRGGFRGGRAGGEIAGGEIAGGEIVSCEIADDVGRRRGGFRGEIAGGEIAGREIVSCEIADGDGGRGRAFSNRSRRGGKGVGKVLVEPFHEGVFIAKGTEGAIIPGKSQEGLVTKNLVPGEAVYKEKKIYVQNEDGTKVEYRVWDPYCSKLAAAIISGLENLWIKPGAKVLYLGAGSGYTVSHVSDLVGPEGCVYAVEISHRSGRELVNMAEKRTNVTPVIEDARHPAKYGMLVGMVDVILSDVDQPDQVRILALNASHFLKSGGHFLCSIKANCINSTLSAEALFQKELEMLKLEQLKPSQLLLLEPLFKRNALVVGGYRMPKKKTVTVIGA